MEHVFNYRKKSTEDSLAIQIRELKFEEKEYESFRIKIESGEWIYIPVIGSNRHETEVGIIPGLKTNDAYKVLGEVKINDEWKEAKSASFVVYPNIENLIPKGTIVNKGNGGISVTMQVKERDPAIFRGEK